MKNFKKEVSVEGYVAEKVPTLILSGCSEELYDEDADELTLVSFYKEYPDYEFDIFEEKFEALCEEGTFEDLEESFGVTLDMSGSGMGVGFDIADPGELSEKKIEELFEEVVKIFDERPF